MTFSLKDSMSLKVKSFMTVYGVHNTQSAMVNQGILVSYYYYVLMEIIYHSKIVDFNDNHQHAQFNFNTFDKLELLCIKFNEL